MAEPKNDSHAKALEMRIEFLENKLENYNLRIKYVKAEIKDCQTQLKELE